MSRWNRNDTTIAATLLQLAVGIFVIALVLVLVYFFAGT